jgi:ribosomal RNA methyltransferase Nop2
MGRRGDFAEKPKKGPGRKAKKQSDPALTILAGSIKIKEKAAAKKQVTPVKPKVPAAEKVLSSHQKKRAKKRLEKQAAKKAGIKLPKAKPVVKETSDGEDDYEDDDVYNSDDTEEEEEAVEEEEEVEESEDDDGVEPKGFTDDNQEWLTPKSKKKLAGMDSEEESDDDDDDDAEAEEEDDDDEMPADDFEAGSDSDSDSDSDDSDDDKDGEDGGGDDLLPIEKKSKKLAKKMKAEAAEADKEMKLNMSNREIFTLPSGQDIEKETAQAPDLQILQERIREVIK